MKHPLRTFLATLLILPGMLAGVSLYLGFLKPPPDLTAYDAAQTAARYERYLEAQAQWQGIIVGRCTGFQQGFMAMVEPLWGPPPEGFYDRNVTFCIERAPGGTFKNGAIDVDISWARNYCEGWVVGQQVGLIQLEISGYGKGTTTPCEPPPGGGLPAVEL